MSRDLHHDLLVTARTSLRSAVYLVFPAFAFRIFGVHAQQVAGEEGRLVASRAAAYLHDSVLLVLRVFGNEQQFDFLFEPVDGGFEFRHLLAGHFAQVFILFVGEDVLRLAQVVHRRAVPFARLDDGLQLLVLLVELHEFLHVAYHFGVGHLLPYLLEFQFQAVEPVQYVVVCHVRFSYAVPPLRKAVFRAAKLAIFCGLPIGGRRALRNTLRRRKKSGRTLWSARSGISPAALTARRSIALP